MIYGELKRKVESKAKGQFSRVVWEKQLKTRAGVTAKVEKHSEVTARFSVNYDKIKNVIAKRANGILPKENNGLPWGKYVDENQNFIEHNGNHYLSVKLVPGNNTISRYYVDGVEVHKEYAQSLCLKSEFSNSNSQTDVLAIKIENILFIK